MPAASAGLEFYRRWVQANAWAEGIGLGATLVLAGLLGQHLGAPRSTATALIEALGAIAAGTVLEGAVLGAFQGAVLRDYLPGLRPAAWTAATTGGAAVAWTLGMVPSTVMNLASPAPGNPAPSPPEGLLAFVLAAGLGLVLGPFLGVPQALLLRQWVARPWRWVPANMLAWAAGMPLVFLAMGTLPENPGLLRGVLTAFTAAFGTGLVVGLIHGRFLLSLLSRQRVILP
jgi:hypothetical protein